MTGDLGKLGRYAAPWFRMARTVHRFWVRVVQLWGLPGALAGCLRVLAKVV